MKFWKRLLIFTVVGLVLCVTVGPASVLVWGVVFVFANLVLSEVSSMNTKQGREQLQREKKEEEQYVEYWGSTQYWEDQDNEK